MRYRFAQFLLDQELGSLVGPSGEVRLRPQALALLEVLVENAPRILSKDELIDRGWGVDYISAAAIRQAISELRQALDDSASSPRIVETVHRRGYRFIAPVERLASADTEESPEGGLSPEVDVSGSKTSTSPMDVAAAPDPRRRWLGYGLVSVVLLALFGSFLAQKRSPANELPAGAGSTNPTKSLEKDLARPDIRRRGVALREQAILLQKEGKRAESLARYAAAEAIFQELEDRDEEAGLLNRKAQFLFQIGEEDAARNALERAIELSRTSGFRRGLIVALCVQAQVEAATARTALARGLIEEALELKEDVEAPRRSSLCLRSFAEVLRAEGDLDAAQEQYLKAAEIGRQAGDRTAASYSRLSLGQIASARQSFDLARSHFEAALKGFRRLGSVPDQLVAQCELGELELARGDWKAAEAAFRAVSERATKLSLEILHDRARTGLEEVKRSQ